MKKPVSRKSLFSLILINIVAVITLVWFSVGTGCANTPATSTTTNSAMLIGTKWVGLISFMGERNTLEFIDETTCIYTFYGEPRKYEYKITGNKLKMAKDTYVIQGDIMLHNGTPYWGKEQ